MTTPALSSTLARVLLAQSPLHAWTASPLNPNRVEEYTDERDFGTWVHRLLLEPEDAPAKHVIVDAPDWRTKAAKDAREVARAAGLLALLAKDAMRLAECVAAVRAQLSRFDESPKPLTSGRPEVTLEWREGDVLCRTRCDWLYEGNAAFDDLKSTSGTAHPDKFARTIWDSGYDTQIAFYARGIKAIYGTDPDPRLIVCELKPPYACSMIALDPEAMALADRKVERAIRLWGECVRTNSWPAYPTRTAYVSAPPWERAKGEAQAYAEREPVVVDDGRPLWEQLNG